MCVRRYMCEGVRDVCDVIVYEDEKCKMAAIDHKT